MLPKVKLLLWVPLVVVACFAFSGERVEAEEVLASWYGPGFSGLPTASGEPYDPYGYTAAHKTMPLGTELLVSYGASSVEVTVNDRGPYVGARGLDLSQGAAEALGLTEAGVDYVDYSWLGQSASTQQYASTDQYASANQYAAVDQYGSGDQYAFDSVSSDQYSSDSTVSTTQYSTGSPTVAYDQYASVEQSSQGGAEVVAEPEAVSASTPATPLLGGGGRSVLVVRPGETLSELAFETGVPVDLLTSQNAIADPNVIYAGQVIYY